MMRNAVMDMLKKYKCENTDDYVNALKEIIQEIALLGLYRADFFSHAAFYGRTSLRIIHGLDRFSEDLDFSLIKKESEFDIGYYCRYIKDELSAYGFKMQVEKKHKNIKSNIETAFAKGEVSANVLDISSQIPDISKLHKGQKIKVKFEVDINPPGKAGYEIKYLLKPVPFYVRVFDLPSLFASKIHAILYRGWENRVKGRDLYDYVWYLSRNIVVNIDHLIERIRMSGYEDKNLNSVEDLKSVLKEKFQMTDYTSAVNDVRPFIKDDSWLKLWSEEFFISITEDKLM